MEQSRLTYLFEKYTAGQATKPEINEFFDLLDSENEQQEWVNDFEAMMNQTVSRQLLDRDKWRAMVHKITLTELSMVRNNKVLRMRRWWTAAAALLLLAMSCYFIFFNDNAAPPPQANTMEPRDIQPPSSNRATITLANGKTIFLDSTAGGSVITQGSVQLIKQDDGKIVYNGSANELVYNTLFNPRGSTVIDITLNDGSRVWLNAGSSITYPVAFIGKERKVQVNGEAYFEVTHDPARPFYVSKNNLQVQVLGTRFNVNAYEEEAVAAVTLLEGSVKVNQVLLSPGQQALVRETTTISNDVNFEQVMAWKNGKFDFGEGTDLKVILRQVARWYDVEVEYRKDINEAFIGKISRQVNVSKVLEKFELTGSVHFKIEGRKVIVNP